MCEVAVLPTVCIQQHTALLSTLVLCTLPCLMKHICLPLGWRHSHRTTVINLPWNIPTVKSKGKLTVAPPMCLGLLFLESLENEQMSKQHFIFPYLCSIPLSSDHFLGCHYFSLSLFTDKALYFSLVYDSLPLQRTGQHRLYSSYSGFLLLHCVVC